MKLKWLLVYFQGNEDTRAEIVSLFCERVSGRIAQSEKNYQLVNVKGKHTTSLVQCAHEVFKERYKSLDCQARS